jgi:type II secretory pathway pseudopilin PulG
MKINAFQRSFQRGQWSLIGLLVTLLIIMILAATLYPKIAAKHSQPGEARTPREAAYGAACDAYVSQINEAVQMYRNDNNDQPPKSFQDLQKYGITDEILDADGCYFRMDPLTGQVADVGHGAYRGITPPEYSSGGAAVPSSGFSQPQSKAQPPGTIGPGGIRIPTEPIPVDPGN